MNEGKTTAAFAVVAVISFGLALWSRPGVITDEKEILEETVGQAIFREFEDPDAATSLEIVKFDEEMASLSRFQVTKDPESNLWRLPSYDDYPADAEEQVRDATTPLIGLTVLSVPSGDRGDHPLYGVINPDDEDLSVAESGVGMLLTLKDNDDKVLASLIIGKEVEKVENQRYVRVPTEDAVYIVELDTAPFTTDFEKWIDGKLLDIRSFDISQIGLRDYAVFPMQTGGYGMRRNFDADVSYNATDSKWALQSLVTYQEGTPSDQQLAPDETLQDQALNDLRNAVQDLQIVGVRRKPAGLATDLKADKSLLDNQQSLTSLYEQGFFPQETESGFEIFSTGGETIIGTNDGVQYVLRFGESDASLGMDEESTDNGEDSAIGLRRFLLVTTNVDESKFPYPDLEVRPETVEEMLANRQAAKLPSEEAAAPEVTDVPEDTPSDDAGDATPAAPTVDDGAPAEEEPAKADATDPAIATEEKAASPDEPKADSSESIEEEVSTSEPAKENSTEDPAGDDCGGYQEDETQQSTLDEAPAATEEAPAASDEGAAKEDEKKSEQTREELEEELLAVQERINRDNQRKMDERKEQMAGATKRVQELNARFAAWYYVVSDSVYKKLKISKEQLISSDAAPAAPGPGVGVPGASPSGLPPGFPNIPPQP